jgi:HAD superfamily hydrolase (TIGR01509 family)
MPSAPTPAARWVLFDMGGVLVDWDDRIIFRIVADRYGLELGSATAALEMLRGNLQSGATSLHEFWRRFARLFDVPVPEDWRTLWVQELTRRARPRRAVFALANELRRGGVRTGLFSNTDRSHWRFWRSTGWFGGFFPRIVSFRVGAVKPDPRAFRRAEELFPPGWGAPVFVDDSVTNVKAAQTAGWDAVPFTSERALRRVLQDRHFLESRRTAPGSASGRLLRKAV